MISKLLPHLPRASESIWQMDASLKTVTIDLNGVLVIHFSEFFMLLITKSVLTYRI